nr:hypothetical protein CFP56_15356 [Quercus suber]
MSNFCLNVAKDTAVFKRKAYPIPESKTEKGSVKKDDEEKVRGRELTLGSKLGGKALGRRVGAQMNAWQRENFENGEL